MTSHSATLPSNFSTPSVTPARRMSAPTSPAEDLPVPSVVLACPSPAPVEVGVVRPDAIHWERHHHNHHHHHHQPTAATALPEQHHPPTALPKNENVPVSAAEEEIEENALVVPGDEEDEDGYVLIGDEFVGEALSGSYDLLGSNNINSQSNFIQ